MLCQIGRNKIYRDHFAAIAHIIIDKCNRRTIFAYTIQLCINKGKLLYFIFRLASITACLKHNILVTNVIYIFIDKYNTESIFRIPRAAKCHCNASAVIILRKGNDYGIE